MSTMQSLYGVDDAVVPEPGSRVVRTRLLFVLGQDALAKRELFDFGP